MADKKFTPKEAAIAVLQKAEQLYKSSNLAKADTINKPVKQMSSFTHDSEKRGSGHNLGGVSEAGEELRERKRMGLSQRPTIKEHKRIFSDMKSMPKPKLDKSEELKKGDMPAASPSPAPTPMPTINQQIGSPFGKSEAPMKGHIKLAKFMGAMEAKRGQRPGAMDKGEPDRGKETGYEKGVNTKGNFHAGKPGQSHAGDKIEETSYLSPRGSQGAIDQAKGQHKQVLSDMKSMPKPKLPG